MNRRDIALVINMSGGKDSVRMLGFLCEMYPDIPRWDRDRIAKKDTKMLNDVCTKCGVSFRRSLLLALMIEAGAQTRDPSICPGNNGGEHDFSPEKEAISDAREAE